MYKTFAYYVSVFREDFTLYCKAELQKEKISLGLLYFLIYIGKKPGCSQRELATAIHVDEGYAAKSVDKLQQDGFIERKQHERDKRVVILTLTKKGEDMFQKAHSLFHVWDEKTLTTLDENEKIQLFALLEKIRTNKNGTQCTKK